MAQPDPKTPTRSQLFELLGNHELVRLFEKLFERVGNTTLAEIEEISIAVGIVDAKANQANSNVTDHSQLRNILWSVAGHIIDTVLQMNGNTIAGDDASGGDLTFTSTTHATKADIHFGISAPRMTYKENDNKLTLGSISFNAEDSRAEIGDPGFEGSGINIDGTTVKTGLRINDFDNENPIQLICHRHSEDTGANILGARSHSSGSGHGAVVENDKCFDVRGVGWTGSHYDEFAQITFSVDAGTISSTSSPGKICFSTTPDGTHSITERMCIRENGDIEVKSENLVLPKISGKGIKVDNTTPTFGWRDLEGYEIPDPTGGDRPTLSVYSGGSIKENAFSNGDVLRIRYHIPHDYVKGTDVFSHVHWSHNGTSISGNVVFGVTSDYAKGHNQGNFGSEKAISITYNTTDIATTPQYRHRIEESAITNNGGSATLIDRNLLEPDGIILVTFELTTNPTIIGGSPNNVFVHRADLHYQSTNIATKDKAPDFYT